MKSAAGHRANLKSARASPSIIEPDFLFRSGAGHPNCVLDRGEYIRKIDQLTQLDVSVSAK
jgi:hypothetical protein